MPTPATNAERYRTYGESRVDMYETFYQEAYAREFAANEDAQAAHKVALQATQREMLQAQRDLADVNEALLKTSAGNQRASVDRNNLLNTALRAAGQVQAADTISATNRMKNADSIRKSYVPDESVAVAAEKWATDAAAANADDKATNQSKLASFALQMQAAAPSIRAASPSKQRANARKYIDAGMKAGLTEEQATKAVSNATQVPGAQLTRASIDADRDAELGNAGEFNVRAQKTSYDIMALAQRDLENAGSGDAEKDNAVALANAYLSGAKTVSDGFDLNDNDEKVEKFKTVDDDTYARMTQALADGEFNAADMTKYGLTEDDYKNHLTVGRIVETLPAKFSASDRGNFSSAKMELLKKQTALSGQLKDLKDNAPKMKGEAEIRAESVARAEPYQKVAPGEGLRLALGIQSKPLRPVARVTDGSMRLTDEQKIMLEAAKAAKAPGYKAADDAATWAEAIYAAKNKANGGYQKGDAFKKAVELSGGDTAKRDSLLAALAFLEITKAAAVKPAAAAEVKSSTPAGVKNDPSNFMMGAEQGGGSSPRLEALLRKVVNPTVIPFDNRKGTETPYKPVGTAPGPARIPAPRPVVGEPPMGDTSQEHDLQVLPPTTNNRVPPVEVDESFNEDIRVVPTFEEMQGIIPGMKETEYQEYLRKNYGVK
jgi:hypothetical protein